MSKLKEKILYYKIYLGLKFMLFNINFNFRFFFYSYICYKINFPIPRYIWFFSIKSALIPIL